MMTTKVEADSEYFEHEFSSSLFKDIKQELVDEMLLTEKEDVKIDFDSEVHKVLSGLDLINCFISLKILTKGWNILNIKQNMNNTCLH